MQSTKALDTCAFVDCTGKDVLDTDLVLGMKVSMGIDPTLAMDAPVVVRLALVDESGRKLANTMVRLVSNATEHVPEMDVELHSGVLPSFPRRFTTGAARPEPEAAAVPALHLLVTVLPGSASNMALLQTKPITLKVKGGEGDIGEALKECARLGLGDLVALLAAFWHVVDYANTPGDPMPGLLDLTLFVGPDRRAVEVDGHVTGSDFTDGMQKNEVAVFTFTTTLDQVPAGEGGISFVKLSDVDNTFRSTLVADTWLDWQATCGPLTLTSLGIHGKPHLVYPSMWYGMLEFRASVEGHWLDALVVFTDHATSASLTGTTDTGETVAMTIDFASL